MKTRLINVENKTSPGVFSPSELRLLVEALHMQARQDFNTSPWVEHGYCEPIEVSLISNDNPSVGSCNIILLDTLPSGDEEALGFHEDVEGGKIPVSYVGVKESREDNVSITAVASHEMVEMAVDPFVEGNEIRTVKDTATNREYIVEIADPLEGCEYKVSNGQEVANFVWPRWFDMQQTRKQISQKIQFGIVEHPFKLAPNGYISSRPIGGGEESWTETFGDKRTSLPPWASRLPRIKNAKVNV